ncbi:hypothetical protein B0T16DRAFT_447875 [Cercophora newfieldiana]|uniref:Methyltransferase type 12 domain-containing protein n=1 Tax=Cercophora newfieldiana TaxID=92897 RepID=A0AA39Y177_9PEZI|nr:hypothetical protein B0T16DRAFT_447875 [Cercophora newfieldiana]
MSTPPKFAPGLPAPTFFSSLATSYTRQTANTTHTALSLSLPDILALHPITPSSIIHDNAAGPGTATTALLPHLPSPPPSILLTDLTPAMVSAAADTFPPSTYRSITTLQLDSVDLSGLPRNGEITHSFLNFSLSTISDPAKALREIHHSLAPGGIAVVTTWKRFAGVEIVRATQRSVKPDSEPMPMPWEEFTREGVRGR